jgi:hypothetical protein
MNREDQFGRLKMLKAKFTYAAISMLAFALIVATNDAASAKKKTPVHPTYEQAWTLCTHELDRSHILRQDAGQRQAAGGACMHRYGYRL